MLTFTVDKQVPYAAMLSEVAQPIFHSSPAKAAAARLPPWHANPGAERHEQVRIVNFARRFFPLPDTNVLILTPCDIVHPSRAHSQQYPLLSPRYHHYINRQPQIDLCQRSLTAHPRSYIARFRPNSTSPVAISRTSYLLSDSPSRRYIPPRVRWSITPEFIGLF